MEETFEEYGKFCEELVIDGLIKAIQDYYSPELELKFVERKWYGGSGIYEYVFKDQFGIKHSRDVNRRMWQELAYNHPKSRARRTK